MKSYTINELYRMSVINPSFSLQGTKREQSSLTNKLNKAIRQRLTGDDVKVKTSRPYVYAALLQEFFRQEMSYL